jgi:hypothetical protein
VNRPSGTQNPNLPLIDYRANQGSSNYYAFTAVLDGRIEHGQLHAAYTWSHSIDNQSDPLAGDFFDLSFAGINPSQSPPAQAAFTREFDSSGDRGSSDFDQRQNFVFYSIWDLPSPSRQRPLTMLFSNWKFSQLAAFRSGMPYTVLAGSSLTLINNRADLVNSSPEIDSSALGGKVLLNANSFQFPVEGNVGNLGRNSFYGPGFYSADISLNRSIRVAALGESGRLMLRADVYNVLNHANLNNPDATLGDSNFGVAQFGRQEINSGFPAVAPLNEHGRQIQLMLRVEF